MKNKTILKYKPELVPLARKLRNNQTYSERLLWKHLKSKQIRGFDFDRQKQIDNYILDFFCNELMLAIEIDGESHNDKEKYDHDRQKRLESLGILFLRFDGLQVINNINGVLQVIYDWVDNYKEPTPNPSQEGNLSNH
ncbi:MAG: endonuclease domain-containing protein [Calditrichaeota bacterium]|nr:MAG: endonuclease domain-containing protein [Calditrichota bacterium]MBL1207739.1 endonuclease domain-containing protein [Calditrichota bacterium]NOG47573.1 endonuclease domain-containing protein [Calditrichota bacterium]